MAYSSSNSSYAGESGRRKRKSNGKTKSKGCSNKIKGSKAENTQEVEDLKHLSQVERID